MDNKKKSFTKNAIGVRDKVEPKLLTMSQCAQYMSCSYGKVRQLVMNGTLDSYKANGMVRILKTGVDDHIKAVIDRDKKKRGTF